MHEYSIASEIVNIVTGISQEHRRAVKLVEVEFGVFSLVLVEQIDFWFNILKKDIESLKKAKINFIEIPGIIECKKCQYSGPTSAPTESSLAYTIPIEYFIKCPECGAKNTKILSGMDVTVKEVVLH